MSKTSPAQRHRLAVRAESDPFYLASALSAFRAAHALDEAQLAELLDIKQDDLPRLALCRHPGTSDGEAFREEVFALAHRFELDCDCLADLLLSLSDQESERLPAQERLKTEQERLLAEEYREVGFAWEEFGSFEELPVSVYGEHIRTLTLQNGDTIVAYEEFDAEDTYSTFARRYAKGEEGEALDMLRSFLHEVQTTGRLRESSEEA